MNPYKDYHPPEGWVKFETLKPGETFHDVIDGKVVQFIKLRSGSYPKDQPIGQWLWLNAANLQNGEAVTIDADEFVYPVDTGWMNEIENYGIKIAPEIREKGLRAVLAYVFSQCEARKESDAWRAELTKYCPSLQFMSFAGPQRVVAWVMEKLGVTDKA